MNEKRIFITWSIVVLVILGGWFIYKNISVEDIKDDQAMTINNVAEKESFQLNPKDNNKKTLDINEINVELIGKTVTIEGSIINRTPHRNGHLFLVVSDGIGEIAVPVFVDKPINHEDLVLGGLYKISGVVGEYNGNLQIVPEIQSDINKIQGSNDNFKITEGNVGEVAIAVGNVLTKYSNADGHTFVKIKLDDENKEITIPIFNNIQYDSNDLKINSIISVKGKITLYNGQLQVIPNNSEDIEIIKEGDDEEVKLIDIRNISLDDRGSMVQVRGEVEELREHNEHLYFKLLQDDYKVDSVLFRAEGAEVEGRRSRIKEAEENYPIRVLAMVDVYQGKLQLIITKVYNQY